MGRRVGARRHGYGVLKQCTQIAGNQVYGHFSCDLCTLLPRRRRSPQVIPACPPVATSSFVHLQHKDHNGYDPDEGQWHASVNEGGEGFQLVVEVIADETHTEPHDREVCQDVGFASLAEYIEGACHEHFHAEPRDEEGELHRRLAVMHLPSDG